MGVDLCRSTNHSHFMYSSLPDIFVYSFICSTVDVTLACTDYMSQSTSQCATRNLLFTVLSTSNLQNVEVIKRSTCLVSNACIPKFQSGRRFMHPSSVSQILASIRFFASDYFVASLKKVHGLGNNILLQTVKIQRLRLLFSSENFSRVQSKLR